MSCMPAVWWSEQHTDRTDGATDQPLAARNASTANHSAAIGAPDLRRRGRYRMVWLPGSRTDREADGHDRRNRVCGRRPRLLFGDSKGVSGLLRPKLGSTQEPHATCPWESRVRDHRSISVLRLLRS